jgi:hypothetical protein
MPIPNLIHPVDVKVEQISKAETFFDEDAREPVQHAARAATVTLKGQVRWRGQFNLSAGVEGAELNADGYVLFRYIDLNAASVELQPNDRFVEIGGRETNVYIDRVEHLGHYPDVNGPTLVKAYFVDRQPSKLPGGM